MEANNNNKTGAKPVTPVEVIVPAAFANRPTTMSSGQLALAIQVGAKHPEIIQSVKQLQDAMVQAGEKYYHVLHALRAAKLPKKEVTAVLLGLGLSKARASELNKLSSCSEETWKKYSEKAVGFRAALKLEAGETDEKGGESIPGETNKRVKAKIHPVPKDIQTKLFEATAEWKNPNKAGKRTEYGFTIERDGITLYFGIFADRAD